MNHLSEGVDGGLVVASGIRVCIARRGGFQALCFSHEGGGDEEVRRQEG